MKSSTTRLLILSVFLSFLTNISIGQDLMTFQPNVLTKAMGRINREEFQRIGNYKVKGNPNVLDGANVSDISTRIGFGANMPLVFDAYTQGVSVMQENKIDIAPLSFEEVDSFVVKVDTDKRFLRPATFINAARIEPGKKMYLQRLANGSKHSLYKSYKAGMKRSTQDLAQTNVMEFEILSEYFYLPYGANEFVKIKTNLSALKKQFASETEALKLLGDINKENFEDSIIAFFNAINSK